MQTPEWEDKGAMPTLIEGLVGIPLRDKEKVDKETLQEGAGWLWALITKMEEAGWRPIYDKDGRITSMVYGEMPLMEEAKPTSLDEQFSLKS